MIQKFLLFVLLLGLNVALSSVAFPVERNLCMGIDYNQPGQTATHLELRSKSIFEEVTKREHHSQQLKRLDSILSCIWRSENWIPRENDPRDFGFDYSALVAGETTESLKLIEKISAVAMAVRSLGFHRQAIAIQELAVKLDRQGNNAATQLFSLSRLALMQVEDGDHRSAQRSLNEATDLTLLDSMPDLAITEYLDVSGFIYAKQGKWSDAFTAHNAALESALESGSTDDAVVAEYMNNVGVAAFHLSKYELAERRLSESRNLRQQLYSLNHPIQAESDHNLAKLLGVTNRVAEAIELQESAISTRTTVLQPAHPLIVDGINDLAWLLSEQGINDQALSLIEQSCDITRLNRADSHPSMATCYHNLSYQLKLIGRYGESLDNLEKALDIRLKVLVSPHPGIANSLNNMGLLYGILGEPEKQTELLEESFEQRQELFGKNHIDVASSLNNLGYAYVMQNRINEAEVAFTRALSIRESILPAGHQDIALTMSNLGYVQMLIGNLNDANELHRKALQIYSALDIVPSERIAQVFSSLGKIVELENRLHEAQEFYFQALALLTKTRHRHLHAHISSSLAGALRKTGQMESAVWFQKDAVNTIREDQLLLSETLQVSFIESNEDLFRTLANWLIEDNRLEEANQIIDLLDIYQNDQLLRSTEMVEKDKVYLTPAELTFSGKVSSLISDVRSAMLRTSSVQKEKYENNNTGGFSRKLRNLSAEAIDVMRKKKQTPTGTNECKAALPRAGSAPSQRREKDSLIVRYLVSDKSIRVLVSSINGYSSCTINVSRRTLGRMVGKIRKNIIRRKSAGNVLAGNQRMYKLMVGPIEGLLATVKPKRLIIDPDSVLRFLPFHALHDGNQYLGERFSVSNITEGFEPTINEKFNLYIAGFGVAEKHKYGIYPLPYVRTELDDIIKENESDQGAIPGEVYLDEKFTENRYIEVIEKEVPFLHITGHFVFNRGKLHNSYYLAGNDKILPASTIVQPTDKDDALDGVSLIAFPSCETALSSDEISNIGNYKQPVERTFEGESLASGAIRSGARTVLASLWKVEDVSTAAFASQFYRYVSKGYGKSVSLMRTRSDFVSGRLSCENAGSDRLTTSRSDMRNCTADWRHPFYWAGIVMYGAP